MPEDADTSRKKSSPGSATEPAADANPPAKPVDTTLPATRIIDVARTEGAKLVADAKAQIDQETGEEIAPEKKEDAPTE